MMHKNTLGSFSFDVTERMLDILTEHGRRMKKTNLASKAGLNYNVCLRYIKMLNTLGWVDVNPEVIITDIGKGVCAKLLDISEARASCTGNDFWPSNLGEKSIEHTWSSSYISSSQKKPSLSSSSVTESQTGTQSKQKIGNNNNNNNNKTIMIVDDEEDVALLYKYFLSSVGYVTRVFINSSSALHEYVSDPFLYDLLVLDIRMQDINGLQLYQSMKAINPACKAIFVSALDAAREIVSILPGTKPQDIIRKPVGKEEFITAVKTALIQ